MATVRIKKYQSLSNTLDKFSKLIENMKYDRQLILPPERILCDELYCCRTTLRRLLNIQEAEGVIVKQGKVRSISMDSVASNSIGSFAFVSSGQGMISNPAWNKLWTALIRMAEEENISTKLILIPNSASAEEIKGLFKDIPDILVFTTLSSQSSALEILQDIRNKILICTEEHYRGIFKNIVAMDNYAAGFMAAQKLAEHGYKKPSLICDKLISRGKFYTPYEKRIMGFTDGCRKYGIIVDEKSKFWLSGRRSERIIQLINTAEKIVNGCFDSLFLHSDPLIDVVYETLADKIRIPYDMGIVTVNSYDNATGNNPPVSAVSHGTQSVAKTIIKHIKRILSSKDANANIGEIMVKPDFHEGVTLK